MKPIVHKGNALYHGPALLEEDVDSPIDPHAPPPPPGGKPSPAPHEGHPAKGLQAVGDVSEVKSRFSPDQRRT